MKTATGARAGLAAATSMLVLGAGLVLAPLMATASADIVVDRSPDRVEAFTPEGNQASYWGPDCRYVGPNGQNYLFLAKDARLLVIKWATSNAIWDSPTAGYYGTPTEQQISHAIICGEKEPTTPVSTPPSTTPVSTPPPTTTTAPPTTTSAPPTTTSAPPTTTSAPPTTTSAPPTTTPPVDTGTPTSTTSSPASSTTPATDPATTPGTTSAVSTPTSSEPGLPVTGAPVDPALLVSVGLGLVGAGAITMVATRRRGTHA